MKFIFALAIRMYWWAIPASKRRKCIYAESCSKFVYRKLLEEGFFCGVNALRNRLATCNCKHEAIFYRKENVVLIRLSNGDCLQEAEIAAEIVQYYRRQSLEADK